MSKAMARHRKHSSEKRAPLPPTETEAPIEEHAVSESRPTPAIPLDDASPLLLLRHPDLAVKFSVEQTKAARRKAKNAASTR
jgi:hypothetical protein